MRSAKLSVLMCVGVAVVLVGGLTGCGQPNAEPTPTFTSTLRANDVASPIVANPSASPRASATEILAPEAFISDYLIFSCGAYNYRALEEAWDGFDKPNAGARGCSIGLADDAPGSDISDYALTAVEVGAIEAQADSPSSKMITLLNVYSACAQENMFNAYAQPDWTQEHVQADFQAARLLCPDHPNFEKIAAAADRGAAKQSEIEEGIRFDDGTYLVGDEIKPGTYATTNPEQGCYWERTDSRGEIIDNNLANSARRVEVTVQATDYSFYSARCGEWTVP